ncbi:MAG: DUF937 domain-containing protein [Acidobacteria bacterium]|nr:DUF937 domain-containing protein [Acidobacteriota bacterium]
MNILEALMAAQGGGAVKQLGQQFGLGDDQTSTALAALVPALAAGLARNATREGGLDGLTAALAGGRHGSYLDDVSSLSRPGTVADGNGILGHILGSKDASRQVAAQAAQSTGVGPDVLKKMLPIVAAMVMGAMAKKAGGPAANAGLSGGLGANLGAGGGLLEMLTPMLDRDRDGSVVDDVAGMFGKFLGGR